MEDVTTRRRFQALLLFAVSFLFINGTDALGQHRSRTRRGASASQRRTVTVKFEGGIYRPDDREWMVTSEGLSATLTSSAGTVTKDAIGKRSGIGQMKNILIFENIPCGEEVKITVRLVEPAGYKSDSRDYTRRIDCGKPVVNLSRLEWGTW